MLGRESLRVWRLLLKKEKGRNRSEKGGGLYPLEFLKRVFVNSSNTCLLSLFRSIRGRWWPE